MVKIWKGIYWASGYSTLWQPNPWQEGVGATWREIVTQFRVLHSAPAYKDDLGRIHWLQTGSSGLGSQPRQSAESGKVNFIWGVKKSLKTACVPTIGGRFKNWLPVDYRPPVVFGLVVNFDDWKKLSLNFPLKFLTGNLKQTTDSDWSTVFREIKEINRSLLPKLAH